MFGRSKKGADEIQEFKEVFDCIDKNGNGQVSVDELLLFFARTGKHYKKREVKKMIARVDMNRDGMIDINEFIKLMSAQKSEEDQEKALRQAFNAYDTDGNGKISKKELGDFFRRQDSPLSTQQINELMADVDLNQDGQIDFKEFKKMMHDA